MAQTIRFTNSRENLFHEPRLSLSKTTFARKNEVMCGNIILQQPDKDQRYVHVKVYRTLSEHFAVVYSAGRLNKPISTINIRNTCITPITGGFIIHQRMFDINTCLTLFCDSSALPDWMNAFTNRSSPTLVHQTSLPIVKEEDADYC